MWYVCPLVGGASGSLLRGEIIMSEPSTCTTTLFSFSDEECDLLRVTGGDLVWLEAGELAEPGAARSLVLALAGVLGLAFLLGVFPGDGVLAGVIWDPDDVGGEAGVVLSDTLGRMMAPKAAVGFLALVLVLMGEDSLALVSPLGLPLFLLGEAELWTERLMASLKAPASVGMVLAVTDCTATWR